MRNVTYINAGAGSGKTFTLTEILSETLGEKNATPSEIILTTFTERAANDFKARSKEKLFEKGLYDKANLLDTAIIGTIHSVAYSIISKFWYHLGLSPKLDILAEEDSEVYRSESLGSLATQDELARLAYIAEQFDQRGVKGKVDSMFWKSHLASIIGYATNYQITDFKDSCEKSKEFYRRFVIQNLPALPSVQEMVYVISVYESINKAEEDSTRKKEREDGIQEIKRNISRLRYPDYAKFQRICNTNDYKKDSRIKPILDSLATMWQTEEIYNLIAEYIDIMFGMATRWQEQYADFKKERNLLDFNDLEKYLLQLLEDKNAAEEIGAQFRFLFVDEYQDCSPIQVKIFKKLSELVEHSYWVGDMKQSIYGFRGSDPKLVEGVINDIEQSTANGCDIRTLENSWRSVPEVVEFCNEVFVKAFSDTPAERVRLKPKQGTCNDIDPIVIWKLEGSNAKKLNEEIANKVSNLINRRVNPVKPSDIAIIDRKNEPLDKLGKELLTLEVPIDRSSEPIMASRTAKLACAVLRLADDNADTLAKAEIAFLTDSAYDTDNLISETLDHINPKTGRPCHDFLDDVYLVNKILGLRPKLKHQSLAEFVESVILELDMYEVAKKCDYEEYVERVLNTLISSAQTYQESAARLDTVASIHGFIDYLETQSICIPGDSSGVHLVSMHKAKGLEWKHVIVTPISAHPADEDEIIKKECFGVHSHRKSEIGMLEELGNVYISLAPYIYGYKTKAPGAIADIIKNTDDYNQIKANKISEEARVLYVAMTRPTHQLILPASGKKPFQWLEDIGVKPENVISQTYFEQSPKSNVDNDYIDDADAPMEGGCNYTFLYGQPQTYEHRDSQPSGIRETISVIEHHDFKKRIPLNQSKSVDMSLVGNCIHHIYQICADAYPADSSVEKVIAGYGLSGYLPNRAEIRDAWDRLVQHVHAKHGGVHSHRHERSFIHNKKGKVYTGSIDLTFDTPEGTVLVDFKTCPMGNTAILDPANEHFAGHYGGQLACYRDALTATGEKVCATYVYYPVSGLIVKLA